MNIWAPQLRSLTGWSGHRRVIMTVGDKVSQEVRADNGSDFVTRDPSFSRPVIRMTHDPVPDHVMGRSRVTTTRDDVQS